MNRDKQIEEMAKQLYGNFGLSMSTARNVATYLTEKKGYRKAPEVANEFIDWLQANEHINKSEEYRKELCKIFVRERDIK